MEAFVAFQYFIEQLMPNDPLDGFYWISDTLIRI